MAFNIPNLDVMLLLAVVIFLAPAVIDAINEYIKNHELTGDIDK